MRSALLTLLLIALGLASSSDCEDPDRCIELSDD